MMIEIALIALLALFAVSALFLWWRFDIDLCDVVAASVTPAIGFGLIYAYGTPIALTGGLGLIAIGIFAIVYLMSPGLHAGRRGAATIATSNDPRGARCPQRKVVPSSSQTKAGRTRRSARPDLSSQPQALRSHIITCDIPCQ